MTDRERLIEILRKPIFPHELVDPIEAVADYLLDNGVVVMEKGEWIPLKDMIKGDTIYHCSKCWTKTGKRRRKRYNFCPNCGADLRRWNDLLRGEQHDD